MKNSVPYSEESTNGGFGANDSGEATSNESVSDVTSKNKPKRGRRKSQKLQNMKKNISEETVEKGDHDNSSKTEVNGIDKKQLQMNAFQFMMNSRHRSIGRNSPGRELDLNESIDTALSKQELKTRKSRLEKWAEEKGAAKRKRDYEEVGNCINFKLEKREKRFRQMLTNGYHSDDEVVTVRKKRRAIISSDNENSSDATNEAIKEKVKKKSKNRSSGREEDKNGDMALTPKSLKTWRFKIKLSMNENEAEELNQNGQLDNTATTESEKELGPETICRVPSEKMETEELTSDEVKTQKEESEKIAVDCRITNAENKETVEENKEDSLDFCTDLKEETKTDNDVLATEEENSEPTNSEARVLRARRSKTKLYDDFFLSDSDEENGTSNKKRGKKELKVAPVFLRAVPKPKLDPKLIEARRQFLLSGVPSSLRKEMDRQQCVEELEFDVFPAISHVQQKSPENCFWDLPKAELELMQETSEEIEIKPFSKEILRLESSDQTKDDKIIPSKIKNCKQIIKDIKSQNPDYPVYRVYNSIYNKSGYKIETAETEDKTKATPKRRGRPRKKPLETKNENPTLVKVEVKSEEITHALWTEKYKPKSSSDIIGNHNSVSSLKQWLTNWLNLTSDLKKKKANDSESEFDITDSDSRDSAKIYGNTVILKGPTGCGKTAAAYAVCNELGLNILEVNASSKRQGKKLLQELQEATQSHQVCKKENILFFVKEKKEKPSAKICVLLIEDIDIVFEQDDGFSAALSQIIATTKRPIILTTTDEPSASVQKVINNHQTIYFSALSSILAIWLQIVCLVEGSYVDLTSIDELLCHNKGDIRRTLLQLQLYVTSGGQLKKSKITNETQELFIENEVKFEDDSSNMSGLKLDESISCTENVQIHQDCIDSCGFVKNFQLFSLPAYNQLGVIWWNWTSILNLPNFSKIRLDRLEKSDKHNEDEINKEKFKALVDCYDVLSFSDVLCGSSSNQYHESLERRWHMKVKDGLGLDEKLEVYKNNELCDQITEALLGGVINNYKEKYENNYCKINMAVPVSLERRWRSKHLSSEEKFQQVLSPSDVLSRNAVVLDYMPCFRTIARCEQERAANSRKSGNRFYSYLRNLGVHSGEAAYKSSCDVFKIWD